ncbi:MULTISPECIES: transposase [unclassified Hymenobacter]|uniref:transposase n=1 Tax=Hymenobacter TaxID=89966 RepID=UPI00351C561B
MCAPPRTCCWANRPPPPRIRSGWAITYLPKQGGGWLNLATWLDRYSRKVVGWDVRLSMPEDLVSEALRRALAVRQPAAGLLVHSDQGSQYAATNFKSLVTHHKAVQRISRCGNCYATAHAESFWSRLKTELLDGGSFRNLSEARLEISHYLAYYNAQRLNSALGYLAPNHFETHFQTASQLCAT